MMRSLIWVTKVVFLAGILGFFGTLTCKLVVLNREEVFHQDSTIISNRKISYRFPIQSFANLANKKNIDGAPSHDDVIVGIQATAGSAYKRQLIRHTWGKHYTDNKFFVVGGEWADIQDEFATYGDIFWVDSEDSYEKVAWKDFAFFDAIHKHIRNYAYIFKTDDDVYVGTNRVAQMLNSDRATFDYAGNCKQHEAVPRDKTDKWYMSPSIFHGKTYPTYSSGAGYFLSSRFNDCLTTTMKNETFVWTEDVWVGILADKCQVSCKRLKEWLAVYVWTITDPKMLQDAGEEVTYDGNPLYTRKVDEVATVKHLGYTTKTPMDLLTSMYALHQDGCERGTAAKSSCPVCEECKESDRNQIEKLSGPVPLPNTEETMADMLKNMRRLNVTDQSPPTGKSKKKKKKKKKKKQRN